MAWNASVSFPRAILHIDGDSFFASCEVAKDPSLRGKPVITGRERGIVSACTYEAKEQGVKRGMMLAEVKRVCPSAIILPSDYETYSLFSKRMYEIVRRYTPTVEEYSIDECFADLTGLRRMHRRSYPLIAQAIQRELEGALNMTFSIGLSATKVLAKIASKWKKPNGLTVIPLREAAVFLAKTPTEKVWGIGPNTAAHLKKHGILSALDLSLKDEAWTRQFLSKPFREIWRELHGEVVYDIDVEGRKTYASIAKTKTFTPPSRDPRFIYAQLSKNVENACIKARRWKLTSPEIFFFLKTQDFKYHGCEIRLPYPTALPHEMLREIAYHFPKVLQKEVLYRATGAVLLKLSAEDNAQLDLFGSVKASLAVRRVYENLDVISKRYGKHAIFLGSSFEAMRFSAHLGERGDTAKRTRTLFKGETARKRLAIPMLGEVT